MNYTISAAFVLGDVRPQDIGDRDSDALHTDVVQHLSTLAELMRAKYPDRDLRMYLTEIIIPIPEYELAPRGDEADTRASD